MSPTAETTPPSPLKLRRLELGMRQVDVAAVAGIAVKTLIGLEQGKHVPRWPTARRLALCLRVPPEQLFPDGPPEADDAGE